MAIAVQIDFPGATLEQYDQVIEKMGFSPHGAGGTGGLFHWVMKTEGGVRVTDVWETQEAFDTFAQEKIGPLTQEVGMGDPEMEFFEVHNYLTAG